MDREFKVWRSAKTHGGILTLTTLRGNTVEEAIARRASRFPSVYKHDTIVYVQESSTFLRPYRIKCNSITVERAW